MSSSSALFWTLALAMVFEFHASTLPKADDPASARTSLSSPGEGSERYPATPLKAQTLTKTTDGAAEPGPDSSNEKKKKEDKKEPAMPKMNPGLPNPMDIVEKIPNPIDVMRGELCMARHQLMGHDKCMEWMVGVCKDGSFGHGLCDRLRSVVKEECSKKDEKACEYAKILGIDVDTDGDGVKDQDDAFPNNAKETKDTDGDGHGDNEDEYPNDPNCWKKPCKEEPPAVPPAPVQAAPAPAPEEAPAKEEPKAAPAPAAAKEKPAGAYQDPNAKAGLQSQGFSGKKVIHADGETVTSDWGEEYGNPRGEPKKSGTQSWKMPTAMYLAAGALVLFRVA